MKARKPRKLHQTPNDNDCITYSDRTSVHVSENGVGATFRNPRRESVRTVRYDDCYNTTRTIRQADYVIGIASVGDVILELKGSDLNHAVSQVQETLTRWRIDPIRFEPIACLIVFGSRIPRITTRIVVFEREFQQDNSAMLRIRANAAEKFNFRTLLGKGNAR